MFALNQTITRKLKNVHWLPLVFWQFVGGGLIGAATVPFAWTPPAAFDFVVAAGPHGAIALAGAATVIVMAIWFGFYFLAFLPRGIIH